MDDQSDYLSLRRDEDAGESLKATCRHIATYLNSREVDIIEVLYRPCLSVAKCYVRGAGFFRSSVFRLMTEDLLSFCIRGGKITLITSTEMDVNDFESAVAAYQSTGFKQDLGALLADPETVDPAKMLCALIQNRCMDLYVAILRGDIYHEKKGYFEDGQGQIVAFDGSGNETLSALMPFDAGNAESFNICASWMEGAWSMYGSRWKAELNRVLERDDTLTFPVVPIQQVDPDFIHDHGIDLQLESHRKSARIRQKRLQEKWDEAFGSRRKAKKPPVGPGLPIPSLRSHQGDGLKLWSANGRRGILEHATGSGKTLTAISAINQIMSQGCEVLVLLPSEALLHQWKDELTKWLPDRMVSLLGGGHLEGLEVLQEMRSLGGPPGILLSTIQSFRREDALSRFKLAIRQNPGKILLIVDECHRIGAASYAEVCKLPAQPALGLSATPEREGDPEGTARIFTLLGPVVHRYSLGEALRDGHLTPYEYHIRRTLLTDTEQKEYDDTLAQIRTGFARLKSGEDPPDFLKNLVFRARRIIRGSSNKIPAAVQILDAGFRPHHHWLVYCESEPMMDEVERSVRSRLGIAPYRYWSGMDRHQRRLALLHFADHGGLMLAIRCLDEGVDIPAISHGIVLSSAKTKREFIQRRGRLLRKAKNKHLARIYDTFALPSQTATETKFILSEIARAHDFGEWAENKATVQAEITRIMIDHGIEMSDLFPDEESDQDEHNEH